MSTGADLLSRAATAVRSEAESARLTIPGPTWPTLDAIEEPWGRQFGMAGPPPGVAAHMNRWSPDVALTVAAWLETGACASARGGQRAP